MILAILAGALLAGAAQAGQIYVMRHLERDAGADPSLNAIGAANAQRLATWFRHGKPVAIFVTPFKRARETAMPLAGRLKITPRDYDARSPESMIEAVRALDGPVLIVGHSNTVPKIIHALGGEPMSDLPDDDYGRIWTIEDGTVDVALLSKPQPR